MRFKKPADAMRQLKTRKKMQKEPRSAAQDWNGGTKQ
jgi:hypothetical protein